MSLKPCVKNGAIVSDVASSKRQVVQQLEKIFYPGIRFVGAHPIAGSEQRGMAAARGDLFEGTPCVVTPTPRTDHEQTALRRQIELATLEQLGNAAAREALL